MGRRKGRKKPTRRQKMANMKPMPELETRVVNTEGEPRLVAAGVRRKGQAQVTYVDFDHFSGRQKTGDQVPSLDEMSDLGKGVVIAIATRMKIKPEELIRKVSR